MAGLISVLVDELDQSGTIPGQSSNNWLLMRNCLRVTIRVIFRVTFHVPFREIILVTYLDQGSLLRLERPLLRDLDSPTSRVTSDAIQAWQEQD